MSLQPPTFGDNNGRIAPPPPPLSVQFQETKKASPLPLILAIVLVLLSAAIQVMKKELGNTSWFYVGYLLTPLAVTMMLAWDTLAQRNGRKNPWFQSRPIFSRLLQIVVILGFVVAAFHIWDIGNVLGGLVVQLGAQ